jgi:hypothetical protein
VALTAAPRRYPSRSQRSLPPEARLRWTVILLAEMETGGVLNSRCSRSCRISRSFRTPGSGARRRQAIAAYGRHRLVAAQVERHGAARTRPIPARRACAVDDAGRSTIRFGDGT